MSGKWLCRRRGLALIAVLPLLGACVTLTTDPRVLLYSPVGVEVRSLSCSIAARAAHAAGILANQGTAKAVDPTAIRLVTWNIHKEADAGWQQDLTHFAQANDVVLLQETALLDSLREILHENGLRWVMASSFIYGDADIGVLTAMRAVPVATCTQRVVEPLLGLPKSSVLTWLRLPGTTQTLAIANIHAINFSLSLGAYDEQFTAVADALAEHDGPIVVAGDFNTWTAGRIAIVRKMAARLNLVAASFAEDTRTVFLGSRLDHIFVRGLDVVTSTTFEVKSSDHNPVAVVLRLPR